MAGETRSCLARSKERPRRLLSKSEVSFMSAGRPSPRPRVCINNVKVGPALAVRSETPLASSRLVQRLSRQPVKISRSQHQMDPRPHQKVSSPGTSLLEDKSRGAVTLAELPARPEARYASTPTLVEQRETHDPHRARSSAGCRQTRSAIIAPPITSRAR
jgi:hypothetical protein